MTTLPLMMATIATSLTASFAFSAQNADFNNDGTVDTSDMLLLLSNFNTSCDDNCPTDLTTDGVINTSDLMALMGQWGAVPNWVAPEIEEEEIDESPTPTRDENRDMSWQGQAPVLLDAIYYDYYTEYTNRGGYDRWHPALEYNQGEHTAAWTASNDVDVQPMVYAAFDWNEDGQFTEEDKINFSAWLDQTIPADYNGPICLDLEGQWWAMLDSSSQTVMDVALNFYIEGLEYAKSLRPSAKIGFWGFPKKSHTKETSTTASIDRLLLASTAIFPDVYEFNPVGNDSVRLQAHVEKCIEMVNGEIPVYTQTFPRYKLDSSGHKHFHTTEEFLRDQVKPSLDAVWTDANGTEHRVSGVAIWDAYTFVGMYTEGWSEMTMDQRKAEWDAVDFRHINYFEGMKELVNVAAAAANERLASTQQNETTSQAASSDMTSNEELETATASSTTQQSRLIRQVSSPKAQVVLATTSYKYSARSYRTARKSWSQAQRAFSAASRKYRKGSSQYKKAYDTYMEAREEMTLKFEQHQQDADEFRTTRATINQAKEEWKTAHTNKVETSETTMLASK